MSGCISAKTGRPHSHLSRLYVVASADCESTGCCPAAALERPSWYASPEELLAQQQPKRQPPDPETELKAGNFGVIRSLLRVLASGVESKATLDAVLDACR